jgi:hypothetical protein
MIKLKIAQMREQLGLGEYDGNFDRLKLSIMSMKGRLGFNYEVKEETVIEEKPKVSIADKLKMLSKK